MIEGHVFDAVLSSEAKSHHLYYVHDFVHGFVAPAFFFSSGLAYGASTVKRWNDYCTWGSETRRRVTKFLGLIALGYALHLPYFSLRKTIFAASDTQTMSFLQSDVLQCVGVTLLSLQIGVLLLKSHITFKYLTAFIAAIVILVSPVMWSGHLSGVLPLAVVSYLTPETKSWFPVFPWAGYILCGALLGFSFGKLRNPKATSGLALKWLGSSFSILAISLATVRLPFSIYAPHDFWKSSPAMFFIRLTAVWILASSILLLESRLPPSVLKLASIGQHSLFVYVLHLTIIYGSVLNRGLAQRVGATLSLGTSLGVTAILALAIGSITLLWHALRSWDRRVAYYLAVTGGAVFILQYLVRPW